MSSPRHSVRFPGETESYRAARNQLLEAEVDLRRHLEAVAAQRRQLPLGGETPDDYIFQEASGPSSSATPVRLSQLFNHEKDTLIIYSFMFGPEMAAACPACTSILDGLDGEAPHVQNRVNLTVIAKSPIQRILQHARQRGWRNLRLLSSANCTYNRDYHAETAEGEQIPALNVFVRRGGKIHHSYNTELLYAPFESGQDGRHVDLIWPIWNLFDLTPEGRGEKWHPRLSY